jgi:hypothetical protein
MVPARVVDSLAAALRGRRSTLSYAGMIGAAERIELPTLALQKPCTSAVLRRREIYKRPGKPGQYHPKGEKVIAA